MDANCLAIAELPKVRISLCAGFIGFRFDDLLRVGLDSRASLYLLQ